MEFLQMSDYNAVISVHFTFCLLLH